ncbi:cytochrome c biogenesis protein CcsA [Bacillaceae bacterium]
MGKSLPIIKWGVMLLTGVSIFVLLFMAFYYAPTEKYMGHVQRIMYFHVPSALAAFAAFATVFATSILYLLTKNKLWDQMAISSAEIGVLFTTLTLITGSLWARPVWNAWWVWDDPRLVTSLILWFIYVAYLMIRGSIQGGERQRKLAAIFGIIGFIDVPIVYYSVKWWRTIHPKVIDEQGVHMPFEMYVTLMFGIFAFFLLYLVLLWHRTSLERMKERVQRLSETIR